MQEKKKKDFAKNKKAFDVVMSHYRNLNGLGSIKAVNIAGATGKCTPNPARPTPLDFRCDVDRVLRKIVTARYRYKFNAVYIDHEALTPIQQERLADRVIGGARHSFEQRLGEQFVQRKIYPVQGRGYFHTIRRARGK